MGICENVFPITRHTKEHPGSAEFIALSVGMLGRVNPPASDCHKLQLAIDLGRYQGRY
jgi:hypothetical protein